jgi:hypothetical protein
MSNLVLLEVERKLTTRIMRDLEEMKSLEGFDRLARAARADALNEVAKAIREALEEAT